MLLKALGCPLRFDIIPSVGSFLVPRDNFSVPVSQGQQDMKIL